MAGLAHIGVGFAMKWAAPKANVVALVAGAEALDLLCIPVMFLPKDSPVAASALWITHGLAGAVAWSALALGIAALASRDKRVSLVVALSVFSHWIVDLITHPMGAVFGGAPLPPDLPLLGPASPKVGLGLYNYSYALAMTFDIGITLLGIGAYLVFKIGERKAVKARLEGTAS
jgi:hypothetical protein